MEFLICLRISIGCDSVDRVYDFCGKHEKGQDEEGMVVRGILNMKAETQFNQKMRLRLLQLSETVNYLLPLQVLLQRREVDGGRRR